MDPLTAALSVISLASALKDLVELAEKVHDSFQKLSRNKQTNDRLSAFTLKSVKGLERIYREHSEIFNSVRELNDATLELKGELESVYKKTQTFVSIPSSGRLSRVKPIFNSWLDRNKIEGELMELNGRIQECHANFCTLAMVRSNLNTIQILASTSRLEASTVAMREDLAVLKNSNHLGGGHHGAESITTLQVTRKKQTTMTGIANRPVSQSPDPDDLLSQVSEDVLAAFFLRSKVRSIDLSLTKLAGSQSFRIEHPKDHHLRPPSPVIRRFRTASLESRHDNAIVKAVNISLILQKHHMSVSVQEGALELLDLSNALWMLDMFHEAVKISIWAADFFRTMANADPIVYQPYLCFALTNLAFNHLSAGNLADATQAAMASLELHRRQLVVSDTHEMQDQLTQCLVLSARIAAANREYDQAFKHAAEAVAIHQGIREVPEERYLKAMLDETIKLGDDETTIPEPRTYVKNSILFEPNAPRFLCYSRSLVQLARAYHDLKRYQEASDTGQQALKMDRQLWTAFPGDFLGMFAEITYFLSQTTLRPILTPEEALPYATRSAELYQILCGDSKAYIRDYYSSLWQCASILGTLERHDEALEQAQEMARVAKEMMEDQYLLATALEQISKHLCLLKRQDEAAIFKSECIKSYRIAHQARSEHKGAALRRLSQTLHSAGWYREAILTCQETILHYRTPAENGNMDHVKGLIDAHIRLAICFGLVGESNQALDEGYEALRLLEAAIDDEPSLLTMYLEGLGVAVQAARSDDANKSMERSQDAIRQFRKLHATYPIRVVEVLPTLFKSHHIALLRCNKPHEASEWLEEAEKWCQGYPLPMPFYLMDGYLSVLLNRGDLLMKLGQMHKGLEVTVRMIELCKSLQPEHNNSNLYVGWDNRTEMLIYLGKYEEALESTIDPVANARANLSKDMMFSPGPLILTSSATSRLGRHQAALQLAEEAVRICRKSPMESQSDESVYSSIWGLLRLGETQADVGDNTRSLDLATEAYRLAMARKPSELYWGDFHHISLLSQFLLALQLFATGGLENALRHLEELVEAQRDNIIVWPGYYPLYMNALHTLCWCYCALDRHDEGVLRCDELGRLAKVQELVNPDIAALVQVELEAQAKRPSRIALWQKIDLRCDHQHFGGPGVVD